MYYLIRKISRSEKVRSLISSTLPFIPGTVSLTGCQVLALLLRLFSRPLYNKTFQNMLMVLNPHYKFIEIRSYCRDYFENLILTLIEILFLAPHLPKKIDSLLTIEGQDQIDQALQKGKGAILYSSHTGNIFYYYYYLSRHYPTLVVATAMDEDLHQLYLIFHKLGCQGLDYDTTNKREMLQRIKQHLDNNGVLVLFGDFYRREFPPANFLGRSTRLPRGTAGLALDFDVPVIPFLGYRTEGWQHKIVFHEAQYLAKKFTRQEKALAAEDLVKFLEKFVLQVPAQWFYWFNVHERWELQLKTHFSQQIANLQGDNLPAKKHGAASVNQTA